MPEAGELRLPDDPEVFAGGGAVWRRAADDTIEVLVVHRPRYDDWTLPKGKVEGDETLLECARREVLEETGLATDVGAELGDVRYRDHKDRPKLVRYWAMRLAADSGPFVANDEVDEVRWVPFAEAARLLSYDHDRPVLVKLVQALSTR